MLTILTEIHLNDDGTVDEDSVGHVEADGKNSLVQELQVTAPRLDWNWSIPGKKTNVNHGSLLKLLPWREYKCGTTDLSDG